MLLVRRIGLFGGVAGIIISVLFPAAVAYAQSTGSRPPLNLMTSPLPLNVVTKPGESVDANIRIKNNGTEPEQLKVELLKFGADNNTGHPIIQERQPQDLFLNWVHFSETNFTAEPNVWKTIKMTISPPKEAAFGYYYAVLFSRASPIKSTGGQSAVEGGVASLVLLNVDAPGTRRQASIVGITASQKVYEFLPSTVSVKIRNSGNIHLTPTGSVFIKRGDTQVAAMDFNTEQGNVLPGTSREFDLTWNDGFPSYNTKTENGKTVNTNLKWDFSKIQKFRFGRYTASVVAVYDDGKRDVPIEANVSFWVIPWRIIGGLLLVILFVLAGVWGIGRLAFRGLKRQAAAPAPNGPDPSSLAAAPRRGRPKKTAELEAEPTPQQRRGRPSKEKKEVVKAPIGDKPAEKVQTGAPKRGIFGKFSRKQPSVAHEEQPIASASRRGRPPKVEQQKVTKPGRPARKSVEAPVAQVPVASKPRKAAPASPQEPVAPISRRGRPPKAAIQPEPVEEVKPRRGRPAKVSEAVVEEPKRGRGRPPKPTPAVAVPEKPVKKAAARTVHAAPKVPEAPVKRGRGRPRKQEQA